MYRYPKARLFVHELLAAERLTGPEAIARGASNFGLITPEAINDVLTKNTGSQCSCMATAKNVVERHFADRTRDRELQTDAAEVWSSIEKHLKQYGQPALSCIDTGGDAKAPIDCQKHAPAIMDVMLQQIVRYP